VSLNTPAPRHLYRFRAIVSQFLPVEITIQGLDREPGSRQEMLHLEPKDDVESDRVPVETLYELPLRPELIPDLVRDRPLRGGLIRPGLQRANRPRSLGIDERMRRFKDADNISGQIPQLGYPWLVQVHHEPSTGNEMVSDRLRSGDLIVRRQDVLKSVFGYDGKTKGFTKIKGPHITLDPADVAHPAASLSRHGQHRGRQTQTYDVDIVLRQAYRNPSGATGYFQHGLAFGLRRCG